MARKFDFRVTNTYRTPAGTAYDVTGSDGKWYIAIRNSKSGAWRIISAAANRDLNPNGPTGRAVRDTVLSGMAR